MNRLSPAETRQKEGAYAHDLDRTGGSVPLPRVGGALSARSWQYQGAATSVSTAAKPAAKPASPGWAVIARRRDLQRGESTGPHAATLRLGEGEPDFRESEPTRRVAAAGSKAGGGARCRWPAHAERVLACRRPSGPAVRSHVPRRAAVHDRARWHMSADAISSGTSATSSCLRSSRFTRRHPI